MKVSVRLFAGLRDLVGSQDVELELPNGATAADLRGEMARQFPRIVPLMNTLVCAVNEDYVSSDHPLSPDDQVALIPPVSGGSGSTGARFQVTGDPLDPQQVANLVRRDEAGAIAVFQGVVRNHNQGRRVHYLEYDAYPSMAVKKMREVAEEIRCRWGDAEVAISHRIGRLEVGETSLLVAVSAPHRREAFAACHYAVDRIKEIVPVWKKEVWEGGESWVEGHTVTVAESAPPTEGLAGAGPGAEATTEKNRGPAAPAPGKN